MKRFSKLKNGGIETVKEKIINPYLVLEALISIHNQKKTVKVYLSSRKFLNGMEISFHLT